MYNVFATNCLFDVLSKELGISSLSILDRLNMKILTSEIENLMDKLFNSDTSYIISFALREHMLIQTDVPILFRSCKLSESKEILFDIILIQKL